MPDDCQTSISFPEREDVVAKTTPGPNVSWHLTEFGNKLASTSQDAGR